MSWFTKVRDAVENVVAAPAVIAAPTLANKLTSQSAQQSGFGQMLSTAGRYLLPAEAAIAGGMGGLALAGPVGGMLGSRIGSMGASALGGAAGMGAYGGAAGAGAAGGAGGVNVGGILGAGLNASAMNEMKQAYSQAQTDAQNAGRFTPYNVYTGTGSTSYDPATGSMRSTLDPAYQGLRTSLLGNAQGGLNALS